MARNFGKNDPWDNETEQSTDAQTTPVPTYTAVDDLRHKAIAFIVLGVICLIPPITPIGIAMIVYGGVQLLFSPVAQLNYDVMIAVTKHTGNGYAYFVAAAIVGVAIILIAGGISWGAVLTMVDAGMVAP